MLAVHTRTLVKVLAAVAVPVQETAAQAGAVAEWPQRCHRRHRRWSRQWRTHHRRPPPHLRQRCSAPRRSPWLFHGCDHCHRHVPARRWWVPRRGRMPLGASSDAARRWVARQAAAGSAEAGGARWWPCVQRCGSTRPACAGQWTASPPAALALRQLPPGSCPTPLLPVRRGACSRRAQRRGCASVAWWCY